MNSMDFLGLKGYRGSEDQRFCTFFMDGQEAHGLEQSSGNQVWHHRPTVFILFPSQLIAISAL